MLIPIFANGRFSDECGEMHWPMGIIMFLGVSLILCPFSRVITVVSLLEPLFFLAIGFSLNNGARYGFYPVEWNLSPIRNWSFRCH